MEQTANAIGALQHYEEGLQSLPFEEGLHVVPSSPPQLQVPVVSPHHPSSDQKLYYPTSKAPGNDAPELAPIRSSRICGLRRRTFGILLSIIAIIVIAAAVGGGVGGSLAVHNNHDKQN